MYKSNFQKREVIVFRQFQRKGYSLFACLGREVVISVLSVATLSSATAGVVSDEVVTAIDSTQVNREVWLGDVGVTGSRAPLATGQAARMVTVLSRDEIQAAPVQSVNDLLKMAVGVDVRQRGPIGAQTDVGIRGGTQEQIAILLNGISICDPQTGHNAFDFPVDLSEIERIEVLEGPAGRVVGTSSLVGAINIVTRLADESSADVHAETGSYGYAAAGGRINTRSGGWNHQLSAGYTRSDGYQRSEAGRLNSDYDGAKAFYQGRYDTPELTASWHAGLSTKGFGSNTFYSARFDEQFERTTKLYTALQGETRQGAVHLRPAIYWNRTYDRFELIRGSEQTVPFNYHRTDVFGLNLNTYFDSPLGRTALGAEFRNEDIISGNLGEPLNKPVHIGGTSRDYTYGLNRSNLSLNLEHNILLRRLTVSAGFVAVKNTWNGMPLTLYPGADASLRITDRWKIYASYNSSLRMPSFTELYYSVGGHKADKYLKPEEMRAVEAGVKYASTAVTAKASVFHHHCRNMIDWVMDPTQQDPVWESVNYTRVNTLGVETQFTADLQQLFGLRQSSLSLAYAYIDEDKQDQQRLVSQSTLEYLRHKLTAALQLHITGPLQLTLNYHLQKRAGTYTTNQGEVHRYKTYSVTDARLAWNAERYSLYIEGNNLLDSHYVDYGNVPQPGAWLMAGAKFHFTL